MPRCRSSSWPSAWPRRCASCPTPSLRDAPLTPDGGVLADYHGEVGDPAALARLLDAAPGVVAHGLFPPAMVSTVLIARGDEVEMRPIA